MLLHKTEKARAEMAPGMRTLGQRERAVLLLADGKRSLDELRRLLNGEGAALIERLLREGYLAPPQAQGARDWHSGIEVRERAAAEPPRSGADPFEGKRSLATARLFLLDICERIFSRRDPARAASMRDLLRSAQDRASMVAAARAVIDAVEKVAGADRADAVSSRLAMLLPADVPV